MDIKLFAYSEQVVKELACVVNFENELLHNAYRYRRI